MTDVHCHVLPGVDDGPETLEESMRVLREAARQGVGALIVTPHFHPARYQVYASQIADGIGMLEDIIRKENLPLRLFPGQECYFFSDLIRYLDAGKVLTMAGTRYVLVEFDPGILFSGLRNAVRILISSGYYPMIAHYEMAFFIGIPGKNCSKRVMWIIWEAIPMAWISARRILTKLWRGCGPRSIPG